MKADDILLMEYVDGTLPPQEREEIEREIGASAEVAERVAHLEASRLPFKEAFATQKLPPVPDSLKQKIEEMTRAHAASNSTSTSATNAASTGRADAGANDATLAHSASLPPSAPVRSRMRFTPSWLAAAFAAGVICCVVVLRLAPSAEPGATMASNSAQASPWVKAAASYQQLFSRETVADVEPDATAQSRTVDQIREQDGLALRVPDLRAAGLTFKGVQRLRFNNKPLVQIVYLPEKGAPISLCVMKDKKPDQAVGEQRVDKMNVVTWRQAELTYALIGEQGGVDLNAIGKQIAGSAVGSVFSQTNSYGDAVPS
jgi:anti-sigma factor RsiW